MGEHGGGGGLLGQQADRAAPQHVGQRVRVVGDQGPEHPTHGQLLVHGVGDQKKKCFTNSPGCGRQASTFEKTVMDRMGDFKKKRDAIEYVALVTQVGLTMAGSILFCFVLGYFLDKWLHTRGVLLVIFIILGIAGGGVTVYRQITRLPRE